MKPTIDSNTEGLLSRAELICTGKDKLALVPKLLRSLPYRLRSGDVVLFEGKECPVVRVSDAAAVLEVERPAREFQTLFGKRVRFQPKPQLVRISSNSEIPVLRRKGGAL